MNQAGAVKGLSIGVLIALVAVWMGFSIVTQQTETLLKAAGVGLFLVCVLLGRRIWLLMVFFVAMDFPLLRGFSTAEMGQAIFIAFSVLALLMRRFQGRIALGEPEFWFLVLGGCIAQAYLRNPAGLAVFGAGSVGARPYFIIGLAFVSSYLLSTMVVPRNEIKWALRLMITGTLIGIPVTELRVRSGLASMGADMGVARLPWLNHLATLLCKLVVSRMSPYRALLRPLFLLAMLLSVALAAGSGYRNSVAMVGLILMAGVYYHHGLMATFGSSVLAALCIAILALINVIVPLPQQMQRALSPFPGTWEERYVRDAEGSTEWRVQMWKEALFTEYWIQNKLLGDGLGFSKKELEYMQKTISGGQDNYRGTSGLTIQQENMMITGGYHSGPVHTIRTVGYVGLAIFLVAMIRLSLYAHRLIKRYHNTEWAFASKFVGIPLVVLPVFFTAVFGDFAKDIVVVLFGFAFLRMFERNATLPVDETQRSLASDHAPSRVAGVPSVIRHA